MRAIAGLWRWRHNPLCRPTDLAEAWVALLGLLMILTVAPLVGALAGGSAQDTLQRSVREQHASRHRVTATVVRPLERAPLTVDPEGASGGDLRSRVLADWTAPDGSRHEAALMASLDDPAPGDRFAIWTDDEGRTAASAAALVEAARRITVRRMVHHRYARLDREWGRAGPDWGRTGADS
ncbi:hypothetical protein [Streptomyces sp. WAC06273]|uniref:Rv1733c family protein n=1 Tax=Streptomyces sp. WAC06273 TaxID=2487422 RepID=UPI000F749276|nr:hypothetical protein [Streptomyces sp. WAC06273]RSS65740.1 hypothetical protein EF907_19760 [Streptomyces sp. WAC06273]